MLRSQISQFFRQLPADRRALRGPVALLSGFPAMKDSPRTPPGWRQRPGADRLQMEQQPVTGYPFDSGAPNRLCFGLFPFDGRVHNLSVSCWLDCDGLLHQAVEEFASAARFAAVETERELV